MNREMDLHNNRWAQQWAATNLPGLSLEDMLAEKLADAIAEVVKNQDSTDPDGPIIIQEFNEGEAPIYAFDCRSMGDSKVWCFAPVKYDRRNSDDADGDGISDTAESGGGGGGTDPEGDDDGDGTPNYKDPNSPGYTDINNDGVNDNLDPDLDGIPNHLDTDSDNNGIDDADEAGDPNNLTDTDGDGVPNFLDADNDEDGYSDIDELAAGTDPNDASSKPVESDKGAWSGNFGDPHISTPDRNIYSFQAVGDYVLTHSKVSGDNFEIQVRYTPFSDNGRQWSGENALAMMVGDDKIELYAGLNGSYILLVNESIITLDNDAGYTLNQGTIGLHNNEITISWADGTLLVASLNTPDPTRELRGFTKIYFPGSRRNKVEGLMGNFDGVSGNDFRLRNGVVLLSPSELKLYTGGYRDNWSIAKGASASLFSQGSNPYDPTYPNQVVSLEAQVREQARQVCVLQGVVDTSILEGCINDVGVTGNVNWANIAAEASEFLDPSRPSIFVNPSVTYAQSFTSITIGAIVSNSNSDIIWSATNGTITGSGRSITFSASFFGQATVTAQLADDPTVSATSVVRTTFDSIRR